jgi:hypothetical protein
MGTEREDIALAQDLNEAKEILSSVNNVAKLLITSPEKAFQQINEVKDNVEEVRTELNISQKYLAKSKEELKLKRMKGMLVLPEEASQAAFTEHPSVEQLEIKIREISTIQAELLGKLKESDQIALTEFKRNLSEQIDLMKRTNEIMEDSQRTQMLVNFHQWYEDTTSLMQSSNQDLHKMLELHLTYGEFFIDGKGDPNQITSTLFKQLELAISLEINNLLHNENKSPQQKLKLIESVLDNIDAKVRGTSSLGNQVLPLLTVLQKQISKEEYDKLPAATREKVEKVLDPKHFNDSHPHERRKSMLISQPITSNDSNENAAKHPREDQPPSPPHKKHKNN